MRLVNNIRKGIKINPDKISSLFFLILSLIVLAVWYRHGKFIGGGEEGLIFWDIERYLEKYRWLWIERGLGAPWVLGYPKLPILYLINLIPSFNITWIHQSIFFLITLFLGTTGIYSLTQAITRTKNKTEAFFAGFFYLFNPYTVAMIYGRFIYFGMLAWGFLPYFLLIILKFLRRENKFSLIRIAIIFFISSFIFSQPAYIIVFWFTAFLLLFAELVIVKKNRLVLIKNFIILFLLWLFVNVWWLYPYLTLGSSSLDAVGGYKYNIDSLRGVSKYSTTWNILVLKQGFYVGEGGYFYPYYSQKVIHLLSITVLIFVVIGWLSKARSYRKTLTLFAFFAWFICKGTNPPLGYTFYNFLFKNFSIAYSLRNPFEKFGIVWVLVYSILFGMGVKYFIDKINNKNKKITFIGVLIILNLLLGKPIIDGTVFPKQLYINVPDYYEELNSRLLKENSQGRVLMTPINFSFGVKYKWGYDGVEPSENLISRSVLASALFQLVYDSKYKELYDIPLTDTRIYELLNEMNVSYLIYNDDFISPLEYSNKDKEIKEFLNNSREFEKIGDYNALTLYKYLRNEKGLMFEVLGNNPPRINYVKISPTKYRITVNEAKEPYELIFKTVFHNNWQARSDNMLFSKNDTAYSYANSWKINKTGSYFVDVIFKVWPWE